MDQEALMIVEEYAMRHLDPSDTEPEFEVYIVWKAKVLQNWKYLISTSLPDGMYYEMTYNGDRKEWYLDAYKKILVTKLNAKYRVYHKHEILRPGREREFPPAPENLDSFTALYRTCAGARSY